jgi:TonB family protein
MKFFNEKKSLLKVFLVFIMFSLVTFTSSAQKDDLTSSELEKIQDENMDYMEQISKILKDYPAFAYSYDIEDGKVVNVDVTGVDKEIDRKKLEVILFDLKSNRNMIKNEANRVGVFYSVDEPATYEGGRENLQREIQSNLKYPEDAKDWGVEGTVFVKFVVNENGEIPFATTSSNIQTSMERYQKDLEKQAVKAIETTSGDWIPGKVEGVNVASLVVVPVTFDFEKNPSIRTLIP